MQLINAKITIVSGLCLFLVLAACSPFSTAPAPGPDKQAEGTLFGAAAGAGAGAITAAQVSAATGPGAWVGAGLGGIFGLLSGLGIDLIEENKLQRQDEAQCLQDIAWAQKKLGEHYARRLELHPNRDIFPADWFFASDSTQFRPGAEILLQMLAELTQRRMPWSRIVVAAYNTAADPESEYAKHITKSRAEAIAVAFVSSGFEPRRIHAQGIVVPEPVLVDPHDHPGRYRQAIELIALDH